MNSKQFLILGGLVLVLVAVLGMVGVIGPTAEQSIFGPNWWFDAGENWAHLVLGVVALLAAFVLPAGMQKPLVILVGLLALVVGVYSAAVSTMLLGANLENPADTVLHIAVGLWALLAAMMGKESSSMPM
ncbi:MAG: hypothetical protein HY617_03960 [Candidatus Sungbacteria bacterium]|nr:hypothetical protein [Candidatus Sungbacteria bacterium]